MDDTYVGEIRLFAGTNEPDGWVFCHGQLLPIGPYLELFTLIYTTYGGDGRTNFQLPDLRNRIPIGAGTGVGLTPRYIGDTNEMSINPGVTLAAENLPAHTHSATWTQTSANASGELYGTLLMRPEAVNDAGNTDDPTGARLAAHVPSSGQPFSDSAGSLVEMAELKGNLNPGATGVLDFKVDNGEITVAEGGGTDKPDPISIAQAYVSINYIIRIDSVQ